MAPSRKIYALKRIRLAGRDREAAAGFIDEIALLNRLRGNANIIQLFDAEARPCLPRPRAGRQAHASRCAQAPGTACVSAGARAAAFVSHAVARAHAVAGGQKDVTRGHT
jgi:hypothetical protein